MAALALLVAAYILPGAEVKGFLGAAVAAAVIALLNALLPPFIAALRLPFMLVFGFLAIVLDAVMLLAADRLTDGDLTVDGFWWALLVALVASAVTLVIEVVAGIDDDGEFSYRVVQRIAQDRRADPHRRARDRVRDRPGSRPRCCCAMRDGNAPHMARWVAEEGYQLTGWEPDLSSQTGRARRGSCSGRTRTSRHFAGWRRRPGG